MNEDTDNRCQRFCPSCGSQCVGVKLHPDGEEETASDGHGDDNYHTWKDGDTDAVDNGVKIKHEGNWMPIQTYYNLINSRQIKKEKFLAGEPKPERQIILE